MTEKIFSNGTNEIHYVVEGEGVPVVLMHGWGCNLSTLMSIQQFLKPNFKVINIDFPGFGSSPEPDSVWNVYEYADLLEEMFDKEGIENPILLGHSFGGRVGIILASRRQVRKLILVDAAGVKPNRTLKYYLKVYSYKTMKHLLPFIFGEKGDAMLDKYRGKTGSSDYRQASPKMRAIMSKVVNEDLCYLMPSISAPTLLVWGENDTATPFKDAKKMEKLIPDSGIVSFPGVGHYSFLENPVQFRAVINSFLKDDKTINKE